MSTILFVLVFFALLALTGYFAGRLGQIRRENAPMSSLGGSEAKITLMPALINNDWDLGRILHYDANGKIFHKIIAIKLTL